MRTPITLCHGTSWKRKPPLDATHLDRVTLAPSLQLVILDPASPLWCTDPRADAAKPRMAFSLKHRREYKSQIPAAKDKRVPTGHFPILVVDAVPVQVGLGLNTTDHLTGDS